MIPRNCYVIFLITDCTVLSDCNFRVDNKNECASSSDFKAHFFLVGGSRVVHEALVNLKMVNICTVKEVSFIIVE